ncbi:MAG: FecCD family ABC transporter permease [Desulfurivibrionaceae bacterium]|jgi:iron complex transport system permease protein|nr:iron ABC transporter permease [Pseudomonadota bacterium]MCG2824022.1 iron ABC transporter permease [Desulfobulbaceae bacterium]MDP2002821.1 iron ABC transporter permease [Desulfurivibrionaceae bacterium]PKN22682.1 MAG: iron ABC transporter permease [Deltaproteobacteria bacterium HGW-Deltaproteobacteria-3]MBU4408328.1 iron ABC transporter permease [Pseudomonadota bacterium]
MRQSGYTIWLLTLSLAAATCGAIVYATGMGHIAVSGGDILRVIAARVTSNSALLAGIDPVFPFVVFDVRLPRILTATLVGGGLAMSGVIYQGILLNPLADPYTLGVSSGAAFGAALALLANLTMMGHFSVPLFAFGGAALTLLVVLYLSSFNGQISANTLILSGVIVGAILAAGISFLKYLADEQVSVIIFWLMGSFASRTWADVAVVAGAVLCGLVLSLFYARDLNILSLGSRSADTLGVESTRVRWILLLGASLVTAVCVSVSGIIGFIGLIVPHLMRFLVGPDNRKLLPVSILAGALLLLVADTVTRAVLPVEVPIGVLTALIGGPFFCVIFRRRQRRAI